MTKIRLQNPYEDVEIKVKEDYNLVLQMLEWLERGNIRYLRLHQIEPKERIVTINPRHFAKIEFYEEET
ncbi:hypothetical protein [Streptococcus pneumoniae]|uniref:hypothetical protein n=1 Tax=Streptococcus pneumoniae TaxID=1313 RepID=UPI00061BC606|nr:hypothetical protein [Streptococcus pneumoniae]AZF89523.1 hypothetical protein 33888_00030 [Streptococcus phage 33888]CIS16983.1 Uncharacterised protein [Streptococcus pneumoniae]